MGTTYSYTCPHCGEKISSQEEPDFRNDEEHGAFWKEWPEELEKFRYDHVVLRVCDAE